MKTKTHEVKPVVHRTKKKLSDYGFATRERARQVVEALWSGPFPSKKEAEFAIWVALDEARTAGFGAGCAWGLSRSKRRR